MEQTKPFVIFVDGVDGAGKTTLTREIFNNLILDLDLNVLIFDIMQSTDIGKSVRKIMINEELDELLRFSGFIFSVFYNLKRLFEDNKHYDYIICDRSQASTFAYNVFAPSKLKKDLDLTFSKSLIFSTLNQQFFEKHRGNFLNIFLRVDEKDAQSRLLKRGNTDIIESRGQEFQKLVGQGFDEYFLVNKPNVAYKEYLSQNNEQESLAKTIVKDIAEIKEDLRKQLCLANHLMNDSQT